MPKIQLKRGKEINLPTLADGEPGFTTDTRKLFVGSANGNVELAKSEDISVSVKMYGAIGDGTTDDTLSIQAALNDVSGKASGRDGAEVYLPGGTYLVSDTLLIPANVTLRGVGRRGSTILLQAGSTCDAIIKRQGGSEGYWAQLRDFCIDGQASSQTIAADGIRLEDSLEGLIDNVGIRFVRGHGIHIIGVSASSINNTIRNCVIRADKGNHAVDAAGIFLDSGSYDGIVQANDIGYYTQGYGIRLNGHNGATFNDNNAWQCKNGYKMEYSNRLRLANCLSDYAGEHGFYVNGGSEMQFSNCQSRWSGCTTPNLFDGFHLYSVSDFILNGCMTLSGDGTETLEGVGTGQTKFGVALTGTTNKGKLNAFHYKNCQELFQDTGVTEITILKTGDLNALQTQNKNDLVVAINEVNASLADKATQTDLNTTNVNVALKADRTYVDTQLQSVASGSPKGVYATLTDLQNAFPTGNTNIYLVSADGKWYYWNGLGAWISGGVYQGTPISDGYITPSKTSFFKTGKNLFNKDSATTGYYVNEANGTLAANASYTASDYIKIKASTAYTRKQDGRVAYYDSNKSYISGHAFTGATATSPANAVYMRFSFSAANLGTMQLEEGSVSTTYVAFTQILPKEILEDKPFDVTIIPSNSIDAKQTKFLTTGKNLFDKSTAQTGMVVNETNGTIYANANYYASDYIEVLPSTAYTETQGYYMAFYDANKIFISGLGNATTVTDPRTFTTPSNAKYVRLTVYKTNIDAFQFELGSSATAYEPFKFNMDSRIIAKTNVTPDTFSLFLPSEICVADGRTIELYNNQVSWCGNINNFHFKWDCTIGKAMKRKFTVAGTTALIGNYPLTLTVFDNNMNQVASATTTIKVVANTISTAKKVLTIGDSLTNDKAWLGEFRTLSNNQYTLVGTRGVAPQQHEGRSGWSAASYLANTTYSYDNSVNPFWDGTRFNWSYYKTQTGIIPDAVQIYLGTNGIAVDPTSNAGNIKQIVDYIRQDDASIPIFLVFTLYRANQDGIGVQQSTDGYAANKGAWKLEEDAKVYNLMTKLYSLLSSYSNLHFVPISLAHDSEFNFGSVSTPVNPRASQTESLPVEGTHPQNQGYYQMADIMFSVFAKYLS